MSFLAKSTVLTFFALNSLADGLVFGREFLERRVNLAEQARRIG